jgi:hypothetical protein
LSNKSGDALASFIIEKNAVAPHIAQANKDLPL